MYMVHTVLFFVHSYNKSIILWCPSFVEGVSPIKLPMLGKSWALFSIPHRTSKIEKLTLKFIQVRKYPPQITLLTSLDSHLHLIRGQSILVHGYSQDFFSTKILFLAIGSLWVSNTPGCSLQFVQPDSESSSLITLLDNQPNTKLHLNHYAEMCISMSQLHYLSSPFALCNKILLQKKER